MNRKNELNLLGKKIVASIEELITYYKTKEATLNYCPLCAAVKSKSYYNLNCDFCPWVIFEDIRCEDWVREVFEINQLIAGLRRTKPTWFTSIRILMLRRWWVTILYGKCPRVYLRQSRIDK